MGQTEGRIAPAPDAPAIPQRGHNYSDVGLHVDMFSVASCLWHQGSSGVPPKHLRYHAVSSFNLILRGPHRTVLKWSSVRPTVPSIDSSSDVQLVSCSSGAGSRNRSILTGGAAYRLSIDICRQPDALLLRAA